MGEETPIGLFHPARQWRELAWKNKQHQRPFTQTNTRNPHLHVCKEAESHTHTHNKQKKTVKVIDGGERRSREGKKRKERSRSFDRLWRHFCWSSKHPFLNFLGQMWMVSPVSKNKTDGVSWGLILKWRGGDQTIKRESGDVRSVRLPLFLGHGQFSVVEPMNE